MLLSILTIHSRAPTRKNYLAPNVNSVQVEKPHSRGSAECLAFAQSVTMMLWEFHLSGHLLIHFLNGVSVLWQERSRLCCTGWLSDYRIKWVVWCSVLSGDSRVEMESLASWPFQESWREIAKERITTPVVVKARFSCPGKRWMWAGLQWGGGEIAFIIIVLFLRSLVTTARVSPFDLRGCYEIISVLV